MSKYNHYTNYSKPQVLSEPTPDTENTELPEEALEEQGEPELDLDLDQIIETLDEDIEAALAPPAEPLEGVVTAAKLNVRKLPSPNAEVLTVIDQNTTVQIETEESTAAWYKVYTPAGVDGYCMKKFITVK